MGRPLKGKIKIMMIDGHEYKKVFNGPSGSWCYEKDEPPNHEGTTTVTFRLKTEDVAKLKDYLREVVYTSSGKPTIEAGYYDSEYHADHVDLSNAYRVLSDMATQLSSNYPTTKDINDK